MYSTGNGYTYISGCATPKRKEKKNVAIVALKIFWKLLRSFSVSPAAFVTRCLCFALFF
jgi:hypothetical protein